MLRRRSFIAGSLALVTASAVRAGRGSDQPTPFEGDPDAPSWPPAERFALWPGKPPGARDAPIVPHWTMNGAKGARELWITGVAMPEVHVFRPERADGSALLALPGGGYRFLSVQNEGLGVARRFNPLGTTVFVLTYRLPREGWAEPRLVAIQDAVRAMRLIRSRASEWGIDHRRLGTIGFSAGGHLAADLAVSHADKLYQPIDAADRLSARPAFLGLIYAATTLVDSGITGSTIRELFGTGASDSDLRTRSPLMRVTADIPPSFLVHAADDPIVPLAHSIRWAEALAKLEVPAEAHLLSEGGHGFGLHLAADLPGSRWPGLFALWLRKHGG